MLGSLNNLGKVKASIQFWENVGKKGNNSKQERTIVPRTSSTVSIPMAPCNVSSSELKFNEEYLEEYEKILKDHRGNFKSFLDVPKNQDNLCFLLKSLTLDGMREKYKEDGYPSRIRKAFKTEKSIMLLYSIFDCPKLRTELKNYLPVLVTLTGLKGKEIDDLSNLPELCESGSAKAVFSRVLSRECLYICGKMKE